MTSVTSSGCHESGNAGVLEGVAATERTGQGEPGALSTERSAQVLGSRVRSQPSAEQDEIQLFRALYPRLRRFAAVWAGLDLEPDDLIQEALARVLRAHTLMELKNPEAYVQRAISNVAKNHYRSRRPHGVFSEREYRDEYPSEFVLLDRMSNEDRAALFLIDVEGVGYLRASQILGSSVLALRARVSRARRSLRATLERGMNDE